jgi:hypothetical protein
MGAAYLVSKASASKACVSERPHRAGHRVGHASEWVSSQYVVMVHQPYRRLALMALLSFASMYVLMYMMVDRLAEVVPNLNQAYMAALMTAPMLLIELGLMRDMYPNKRANATVAATAAVLGVALIAAIRSQAAIDDEQLLKSMIPHHSGAILMCQQADLEDPDVLELCEDIVESQLQEIELMRNKL